VGPSDAVLDLGSGDGRFCVAACQQFGAAAGALPRGRLWHPPWREVTGVVPLGTCGCCSPQAVCQWQWCSYSCTPTP